MPARKTPRAHYFLGVYHLVYKTDLARARADFNQALKLRPGYPEAEAFLKQIDEREPVSENASEPRP